MKFDLKNPCAHCPFRADRAPFLKRARVVQILRDLLVMHKTFACHETTAVVRGKRTLVINHQHCAGALIMLKKTGAVNWRVRLAATLGIYDPSRISLKSRIFSPAKMVEAQES